MDVGEVTKLAQTGPQGAEDRPRVVDLLAVDDDAEFERILVAEHSDVQADSILPHTTGC